MFACMMTVNQKRELARESHEGKGFFLDALASLDLKLSVGQ